MMELRPQLFAYLLGLGDDALVLGHRLSEWCGHAPQLEEDIALANVALDCLGHGAALLEMAAEVEQCGRTSDQLAFFREATEFKNCTLVELGNGDFAETMARQLFVDTARLLQFDTLSASPYRPLADFAAKALKEIRYHFRHSSRWVVQLGDGTAESKRRMQQAIDSLWRYVPELLAPFPDEAALAEAKLVATASGREDAWRNVVAGVLKEATLEIPSDHPMIGYDGRRGRHTEHLGHMLAEMQSVARLAPNAKW